MKYALLKVVVATTVAVMLVLATAITVSAEEEKQKEYYAKEGIYLGLTIPYNAIGGDFDGEHILTSSTEVVGVPKVASSFGWWVALGSRMESFGVELSYLWSNHDITWAGAKSQAKLTLLCMDFRYYLFSDHPTQPYLLLGWIPYATFKAKELSANLTTIGDATFFVPLSGLHLGGGMAIYLHPRVSLSAGVEYRVLVFRRVTGVDGEVTDLEQSLNGNALNFSVGMAITLGQPSSP